MAGAFQSDSFQSDTFQEDAAGTYVFAQAQCKVKATSNGFAQAQVRVVYPLLFDTFSINTTGDLAAPDFGTAWHDWSGDGDFHFAVEIDGHLEAVNQFEYIAGVSDIVVRNSDTYVVFKSDDGNQGYIEFDARINTFGAGTGNVFVGNDTSDTWSIHELSSGVLTGTGFATFPLTNGLWYSARLRVVDTHFQFRIWPLQDDEPIDWLLDIVDDTDRGTSGGSGFWLENDSGGKTYIDTWLVTNIPAAQVGQAQAKISQPHPRQYAQAQVFADRPFRFAQAQVYINTFIIVDHFASATTAYDLTDLGDYITQDMTSYDVEANDPDPVYSGTNPADGTWLSNLSNSHVGWMQFQVTKTGIITFDTLQLDLPGGSDEFTQDHDTLIGIYTGASGPGSWHVVASNDDYTGVESFVSAPLSAGTYYLQVGFYSPTSSPLTVRVHYQFSTSATTFAQAQALIDDGHKRKSAQAAGRVIAQPNFYERMVVAHGAAAFWPLDENLFGESASGPTIDDYAFDIVAHYDLLREFGYLGYGPIGFQTGIPTGGHSVFFNGPFGYLDRYNQSQPISAGTNWAIEVWVNVASFVADQEILHVGNLDKGDPGAISINVIPGGTNKFQVLFGGGGGTTSVAAESSSSISLNTWYHLLVVRAGAGTNTILYQNGIAQTSFTNNIPDIAPPTTTVFMGAGSPVGLYIDEFAIYNSTLTREQALDHYTYGIESAFVRSAQAQVQISDGHKHVPAQAQADIKKASTKSAQAQTKIKITVQKYAQAQALLNTGFGLAQAKTDILQFSTKSAQALTIIASRHNNPAQVQAKIRKINHPTGLAQAHITGVSGRAFAQSNALITSSHKITTGQSQAYIRRSVGFAQAQCLIKNRFKVAQVQAKIKSIGVFNLGQTQAWISAGTRGYAQANTLIISGSKYAQAQARIRRFDGLAFAQAQARIRRSIGYAQAQCFIQGGKYLVRYNQYLLPGYAQTESLESTMNITENYPAYGDASLSEYIGLQNKVITVNMRVSEATYLESKNQVQLAASMVRSKYSGWAKLYIQRSDRHYLAKTSKITTSQSAENRHLDYAVEFQAKPWLLSDIQYTVSGTGLITITRTFDDGGWTPATIQVSGTDVTISGYTATQYTGFISISGAVTDMLITSQPYTASVGGLNRLEAINNPNFELYIGPGTTYIDVSGATNCIITYTNRWHL